MRERNLNTSKSARKHIMEPIGMPSAPLQPFSLNCRLRALNDAWDLCCAQTRHKQNRPGSVGSAPGLRPRRNRGCFVVCTPRISHSGGSKSIRFRRILPRKANAMKRTPSPPISPEMAAHIKFLVSRRGLYQHQVAALLGLNQGRISEIMRGYRFPTIPPAQGAFPF